MHNTFITRDFDWGFAGGPRLIRAANKVLRGLGKRVYVRASGVSGHMTNVEQRINLYHMVSQLLAYDVPGDFIEIGCFTGQTAVLISRVLNGESKSPRTMHVYDSFGANWDEADPRGRLERNFSERSLPIPQIHAGYFKDTIPQKLPDQIAFAHIDCGYGGDVAEHSKVIEEVLTHIYPRMPRGAICSFIDYFHPTETPQAEAVNPGVKAGCDRFLAGKPEVVSVLYAAEYNHAYFRRL